ncbi:phosphoribosyltransferase [Thermodesulfobacteriota bacterium]
MKLSSGNISDLPELRERTRVFKDRKHAGKVLAEMLEAFRKTDGIVLGIPAGGVPVGAVVASRLGLLFDVAVVSKITLPWNTEAGYGAVAFDGTLKLNEGMLRNLSLTEDDIQKGISKTSAKVKHRVDKLRGGQPFPDISARPVILIDDGIASGFTLRVAVEAVRNAGAGHVMVAVPTGHRKSVEKIAEAVAALYCPNIRGGLRFAVASAYEDWYDVAEEEVLEILEESKKF